MIIKGKSLLNYLPAKPRANIYVFFNSQQYLEAFKYWF